MRDLPNVWMRTLTALFLLPLVFAAIFYLSSQNFAWVSAGVILLAAWEWARLVGFRNDYRQGIYVLFMAVLIYCLYFSLSHHFFSFWWLIGAGVIAWSGICLQLAVFARIKALKYLNIIWGFLILPACWQALNVLCFLTPRPQVLLALFFIVWGADTVAYFAGRRFGKHKLAPMISPGKTWEGFIGAMVAVAITTALLAWFLPLGGAEKILPWTLLALATALAAVIGDLFESLLKRMQGVKDSSQLLPGHGGILDRLDSLLAAAPIFAFGLLVLGLI